MTELSDWQKEDLLVEWALSNGWRDYILRTAKEQYERLFGREFSLKEVIYEESKSSMRSPEPLGHDFLKHFFQRFPKVQAEVLPSITVMPNPTDMISPRVIEKTKYIDAWEYHIKQIVMIESHKDRIDYLYGFLPAHFKEMGLARENERLKRVHDWK